MWLFVSCCCSFGLVWFGLERFWGGWFGFGLVQSTLLYIWGLSTLAVVGVVGMEGGGLRVLVVWVGRFAGGETGGRGKREGIESGRG